MFSWVSPQRDSAQLTEPLGLLLAAVRRVMLRGRRGEGCASKAAARAVAHAAGRENDADAAQVPACACSAPALRAV